MKTFTRAVRGAAAGLALLAGAGCSQLGTVGDILGGVLTPAGGGQGGEVYGEIRAIDTQRQIVQIQTQQGQVGNVYFDNRTQVVYNQQRYSVTALERGDVVAMRIQQDQRGNAYTDYIQVTQSVQDRGGGYGGGYPDNTGYGTTRLEGNVGWVDTSRGQFELRTSRGTVTVVMPYSPSSGTLDRFRRLRGGDYVRVEGQLVSQNRFELSRFY